MNGVVKTDSKRRIVLPRNIVEEYGQKFVIVRLPGEILLKPLPKDPLKALQEEGRKLKVTGERFEKEVEGRIKERV